jgi:hypothetical protein
MRSVRDPGPGGGAWDKDARRPLRRQSVFVLLGWRVQRALGRLQNARALRDRQLDEELSVAAQESLARAVERDGHGTRLPRCEGDARVPDDDRLVRDRGWPLALSATRVWPRNVSETVRMSRTVQAPDPPPQLSDAEAALPFAVTLPAAPCAVAEPGADSGNGHWG